jgi:hypothetical protein
MADAINDGYFAPEQIWDRASTKSEGGYGGYF